MSKLLLEVPERLDVRIPAFRLTMRLLDAEHYVWALRFMALPPDESTRAERDQAPKALLELADRMKQQMEDASDV